MDNASHSRFCIIFHTSLHGKLFFNIPPLPSPYEDRKELRQSVLCISFSSKYKALFQLTGIVS